MPDTLSAPPRGLASVPTTPTSNNSNNNNNNSKNNSRPHRQDSSSTSVTHLSPTFPGHHHTQTSTTAATTTAQPSPSSSHPSSPSHSSHTSTALTTGATAGERGTDAGTAVAVRMDASPIILFTLQYSVAVVQGVTIYILSVVFSILQLVSGQLNDPPSSSGSTHSGSGARKKGLGSGDEEVHQRRQQRRRRWSGSGSGTTSLASTSGGSWAQNLIAHTQQIQAQSETNPTKTTHGNAPTGGVGGGGTLTQRVEALRFLGSTIANLVGSYARLTTSSSPAFSSTGENIESTPQKRLLASSMSTGAGGTGPGRLGEMEMSYSSRIRRALVKTLSGHANPLPRSMKRVTFNDTLQFHTTTTSRRPRARFGDEDDEEDKDGDGEEEGSSPVQLFFSGEFGAGVTLSPEESISTLPIPSVPLLVPGEGKKVKKNRPPSIMPSVRDRRQLQEQDDLEDMAAAVQETGARSGGFSVVSNGRSIPVSTTAMRPGFSTSTGKILASTITIALPPLSRPRKQQQQPQTPTSPVITIAATSTTTTTTSMTPTKYSPTNGNSGLASALLSSLMMPASPGPISDVVRSLLSPTTLEASAPVLSDSDSSKSSSGGRGRGNLKKTRSAPSKISTFLQQHRLARQQQQQQGRGQMQGLFSPEEYTSSPRDVSSPLPSATAVVANAKVATRTESTAPSSFTASVDSATASNTTTVPIVRPRQTSTSSAKTLIRPRSLYSIQSTVSSAVAAVIGEEPPPSVPVSLTTSMSHSLSPRLGPSTFSPTMTTTFSPTHQRKRSASVDLTNIPSLRLQSSSSTEVISTPGLGNALEPSTPTSSGSGGRSLMYKLTHPQRYKRELELQLQSQHQKDTGSLSSATPSPSASQVALPPLSPTGSITSIQGTLHGTPSASATATTRMVYPFSRSFTDMPASLSYLSDDPHPTHLPPPHTYSSMSVESPSPPTTAFEATAEIHHPFPLPLTPPLSDKDTILAAAWDSTTPPLSMFFPSSTTQHSALASLPSPAHSSSSSPTTTTSATGMLSNMKDPLTQLRRTPSPRPRSMAEDEDEDGVGAHTTFAACGFSLPSSSSSSS